MGLEKRDIGEEEKNISFWFSLGEHFVVDCGNVDRKKEKENNVNRTLF